MPNSDNTFQNAIAPYAKKGLRDSFVTGGVLGLVCIGFGHQMAPSFAHTFSMEVMWLMAYSLGALLFAAVNHGINVLTYSKKLNATQLALVQNEGWNGSGKRVLVYAVEDMGECLRVKHLRKAAIAHMFQETMENQVEATLEKARLARDIHNRFLGRDSHAYVGG